jgi:hypothetical protein
MQKIALVLILITTFVVTLGQEKDDKQAKALYLGNEGDSLIKAIKKAGFDITVATMDKLDETIKNINTKNYNLVVVVSYDMCKKELGKALEDFLKDGGGVILYSGVPVILSRNVGNHLSFEMKEIHKWFGATRYTNTGGGSTITKDKPFGLDFVEGTTLVEGPATGGSSAAIQREGLSKKAEVIAQWADGLIWAFTHEYEKGRLYYQACEGGKKGLRLFRAGANWASRTLPPEIKITPELEKKVAGLIEKLGAESFETREQATEELIKIGEPATSQLKKASENEDAEVRWRAQSILEEIE